MEDGEDVEGHFYQANHDGYAVCGLYVVRSRSDDPTFSFVYVRCSLGVPVCKVFLYAIDVRSMQDIQEQSNVRGWMGIH